jgi:sterol desaturase/sphingolipid hydroxylase (fatty acid hydroxylase superfamily)
MSREVAVRVASFLAVSLAMAGWEFAAGRRPRIVSRALRWPANLGILFFDTALVRILFAALPLAIAARTQEQGWGLLNAYHLPFWMKVACGVILLDFVIYLQHVTFHAVPIFWRLHMMHHADLDFDFTTGGRFHPIEILLSMGIKTAAVAALGPPPLAFFLFEVLLNATSMFNHGNVSLPPAVDRTLRLIVVTPDKQLRVQPSLVGSNRRNLSGPAGCRARRDDHRACTVPGGKEADASVAADASLPERRRRVSDGPERRPGTG